MFNKKQRTKCYLDSAVIEQKAAAPDALVDSSKTKNLCLNKEKIITGLFSLPQLYGAL